MENEIYLLHKDNKNFDQNSVHSDLLLDAGFDEKVAEWAALNSRGEDFGTEGKYHQEEKKQIGNLITSTNLAPGVTVELIEINTKDGVRVLCFANGIEQQLGAKLKI